MQAHFILSVKNRAASTGSDPRVCVGLRIDWSWNRFRMGRWKDQALNWVHITKKYSSLQQVIRYGVNGGPGEISTICRGLLEGKPWCFHADVFHRERRFDQGLG